MDLLRVRTDRDARPLMEPLEPRLLLSGVGVLPGDANGDGVVDGADYTAWADNYDPNGSGFTAWADGGWTAGYIRDF